MRTQLAQQKMCVDEPFLMQALGTVSFISELLAACVLFSCYVLQEASDDMKSYMSGREKMDQQENAGKPEASLSRSGRKRRRRRLGSSKKQKVTPKKLFHEEDTQTLPQLEDGIEKEDNDPADVSEDAEGLLEDEESAEDLDGSGSEDKDLFGSRFKFATPPPSQKHAILDGSVSGKCKSKRGTSSATEGPEVPAFVQNEMDEVKTLMHKVDKRLRDALPSRMPT